MRDFHAGRAKRAAATLLAALLAFLLSACQSSQSFTFQIDNGEKIKVTLDTTDGYRLSQKDGVFTVEKDEQELLNGFFLTAEGYEQKAAAVLGSSDVVLLEASPEDNPTDFFYQFDGEAGLESDLLFKVEGAETGVMIGSLSPREDVAAAFQLLTFEKLPN